MNGESMAQYLLSVFQPDGPLPAQQDLERITAGLDRLNEEIQDRGAWVFAGGLHPPDSATVIRAQENDLLITDGPFAESKEHLGGFTVIEASDAEDAMNWGGKLARVTGLPIEVRLFRGRK
jgi:hypothetical protein